MFNRHSAAGVIVYRDDPKLGRLWLVIRHASGHWEFAKGHIEPDEDWRTTALRELQEETGISTPTIIAGFARTIRYAFREKKKGLIQKIVTFALAEVVNDEVKISHEHTHFAFLNFEKAMRQLTHAGTRAVLRDAAHFLTAQSGI